MDKQSPFAQIVDYIDSLHADIGLMVKLLEGILDEKGYVSPMGGSAYGSLTSHFEKPRRWRMRWVYRLFNQTDSEQFNESIFYLVMLHNDSAFDFPPVICAKVFHPPLDKDGIRAHVISGIRINSLATNTPHWKRISKQDGWCKAEEPDFPTKVLSVQGYILNLFDMEDRDRVIDNIVVPLTNTDRNLDEMLTVTKYAFPALSRED
jgi:hypothetical protein